jgi:hypothetical protein
MSAPLAANLLSDRERALLIRRYLEGLHRLPTTHALKDFEMRAPYSYMFRLDDPSSVTRSLPPEWQEIKDRLDALHADAVAGLQRSTFGAREA